MPRITKFARTGSVRFKDGADGADGARAQKMVPNIPKVLRLAGDSRAIHMIFHCLVSQNSICLLSATALLPPKLSSGRLYIHHWLWCPVFVSSPCPWLSSIVGCCMAELLTALELRFGTWNPLVPWSLDEHTARNQTTKSKRDIIPPETALNFHSAVHSYSKKNN